MLFAAILVFVDTPWLATLLVPILFLIYFSLQLGVIKARASSNEWLTCALFSMVGYISILLFFEENHKPKRSIGWLYIGVLTTWMCYTTVGHL